jgi:hypothetical protein
MRILWLRIEYQRKCVCVCDMAEKGEVGGREEREREGWMRGVNG